MKATNFFFIVFLVLGTHILAVKGSPSKDIGQERGSIRKNVAGSDPVIILKECDDEDECDKGSGGEEKMSVKGSAPVLQKDTSLDANFEGKRTNKQSNGPTYHIIQKSVTSRDKASAPSDSFIADDLSQSWSNKGTKNRIFDIISKSITKGNKQSIKDCDDEDDCGSAIDVFSNDSSGDVIVKDKNSEETTYYEVVSKSLVAKDDKTPVDAFSNGDWSSSSISQGNRRAMYEIIYKSLDTRDKDSTPTDVFTGDELSKLGSWKRENGHIVYEVISKSITGGKKKLGKKDCDDEDECGSSDDVFSNDASGDGAISKEKDGQSQNGAYYEVISKSVNSKDNSELTDAFTGVDESNGNLLKKENGSVTYEIISKFIDTPDKISKNDCDDEDDCGSANDVFINEGSGDKVTNGPSPMEAKESTPLDSFAAKESSNTSWKKGQTQVIYEIISKSVRKADKGVPNKNCDDQDECGSADDIFANDGSEHFSERLLTKDKSVRPEKTSYYEVISKSIVENKKLTSKECADDDEDCALSNVGSGDDTFSARRTLSPPKHQLKPQVQSNIRPLFHGTSFLRLPALGKDAHDNIETEMEIFPLEKNGVLLYNGWKPNKIGDFISLSLQDSFVELSYDCGSGPAKIRTDVTVKLSNWNKIQFFRTGRLGSLTLNNGPFVMGMSPEPHSALTLNGGLMIGGVSEDLRHEVSTNVGIQKGFTGYIRNLKIQGKAVQVTSIHDLENLKKNPCLSSPCQHDEIKIKAISFHKESYLRFNHATLLKILKGENGFVTFFIITTQSKGMLIWEAQKLTEHFQRYATVGLTVGFISLSFNLGSGNNQIYSSIPVDDGEWHNITIARSKGFCYLIIDGQHKKVFSPISNGLTIGTTVDFYIGGIPNIKSATKGLHKIGFKGCMKNFEVNSKYLDFNHEYIASQNVGHCGEI